METIMSSFPLYLREAVFSDHLPPYEHDSVGPASNTPSIVRFYSDLRADPVAVRAIAKLAVEDCSGFCYSRLVLLSMISIQHMIFGAVRVLGRSP